MVQSKIKEAQNRKDPFPALYASEDRGVIIIAVEDLGGDTFAGMIVHPESKFGNYSATWSKTKYRRMPKDSELTLKFIQE